MCTLRARFLHMRARFRREGVADSRRRGGRRLALLRRPLRALEVVGLHRRGVDAARAGGGCAAAARAAVAGAVAADDAVAAPPGRTEVTQQGGEAERGGS
eukprot:gene3456-biopygen1460